MIFIHTLRMAADLSVYFFIAELYAASMGAGSQFIPFLLLSICYGILVFMQHRNFNKIYMLLPLAVLFMPGSRFVVLLPAVAYILYLIYKENTTLSWDRQSELFSICVKFFPVVGMAICLLGNYSNFIQYSLPMAFASMASSIFLMRMLRHSQSVYMDRQYQRKNIVLFTIVLCLGWLFSRDFVFRLMGNALSFMYMKGIYPILNGFIWLFMGLLRIIMYIFSWFKFGEIQFEENHLGGGEMGPSFKDAVVVGDHVATTETVFAIIAIIVLFVCAFYFFRWLALHSGGESVISRGFDMIRSAGPAKQKKERATTTALQIRRQYRIFLKLYKDHGGKLEKACTSQDVLQRSEDILPEQSADLLAEMREIYLKARYGTTATKADLKRIKQINKELAVKN